MLMMNEVFSEGYFILKFSLQLQIPKNNINLLIKNKKNMRKFLRV